MSEEDVTLDPSTMDKASALRVKLPQFSTTAVSTWFLRAECQFRLRNITSSQTKADYILEALTEQAFERIAPWLEQQADTLDYDALKRHLLSKYTLTSSARAEKALDLMNTPLGDLTATWAYEELKAIITLPDRDSKGKPKEISLLREIWLRRLPPTVRAALTDTDVEDVTILLDKADALLDAAKASTRSAQHIGVARDQDVDKVMEEEVPIDGAFNQRRIPARDYKSWNRQDQYLCFYHKRFGAKARKCVTGCNWKTSKN